MEKNPMCLTLALALLTLCAGLAVTLSAAALAGAVPAVVLIERELMNPENP
jgi:hypothetical protein